MNLGYKLVRDDLASYGGFQWPSAGQVVAGDINRSNTGPCPLWPGDGLCVALTFRGATSGGFRPRVLWLAYDDVDVLGRDLDKVRASTVTVLGTSLLRDVSLLGADLRGAYFRNANLAGVNLRNADLYGAYFRNADLSGADLSGADLRGADLSGARPRDADLRNADLSNAYLNSADLRGADLYGAKLVGANLRNAGLRGADLRGADLRGAYRLSSDLPIDGWQLDSVSGRLERA